MKERVRRLLRGALAVEHGLVFAADPMTASQDDLVVVDVSMPSQLSAPHAAPSGIPNLSIPGVPSRQRRGGFDPHATRGFDVDRGVTDVTSPREPRQRRLRSVHADLKDLFERLGRFRGEWVSGGWSWDRRLNCVASTFDIANGGTARSLVLSVLPEQWTSVTLPKAPRLIARVARETGGVRADQAVYATPDAPIIAYGLWWPWGSGASTISMRVGLAGRVSEDELAMLRDAFGVSDL